MTPIENIPHSNGLPVLAHMEDVREDQHLNPTESSQPTANIIRQAINKQCDVVNLYSTDEESA
jgi:hypothetical protein